MDVIHYERCEQNVRRCARTHARARAHTRARTQPGATLKYKPCTKFSVHLWETKRDRNKGVLLKDDICC